MDSLIKVISNNFWTTVFVLALVPLATNIYIGVRRKILNMFRSYPTYRPGAVFRCCVCPAGWVYPELECISNGLFRVAMRTHEGGVLYIENRHLQDWVLPMVYDPSRDPTGVLRDKSLHPSSQCFENATHVG